MDLGDFSFDSAWAFLGAVVTGAAWTGRVHQRVNNNDKAIEELKDTIAEQFKTLNENSLENQRTLGQIEGKLDTLFFSKRPSE
jgi:hypothetical protein